MKLTRITKRSRLIGAVISVISQRKNVTEKQIQKGDVPVDVRHLLAYTLIRRAGVKALKIKSKYGINYPHSDVQAASKKPEIVDEAEAVIKEAYAQIGELYDPTFVNTSAPGRRGRRRRNRLQKNADDGTAALSPNGPIVVESLKSTGKKVSKDIIEDIDELKQAILRQFVPIDWQALAAAVLIQKEHSSESVAKGLGMSHDNLLLLIGSVHVKMEKDPMFAQDMISVGYKN